MSVLRSKQRELRSQPPAAAFTTCRSCRARMRVSLPRCRQCGARVPVAVAPGRVRELTEMQKRILLAAVEGGNGDTAIYVLWPLGSETGEIKAGDQRLGGRDAVDAVQELFSSGYLTRHEDSSFRLTRSGRSLAGSIL